MSVVFTSCQTCSTSKPTVEDLLSQVFMCGSDGTVAMRVYTVNASGGTVSPDFCGLITDYAIVTRNVNGVDHDGIVVAHNLNKTTAIFLTVTDNNSVTVIASAEIINANTIFIMLDGLTDGAFCVS